MSTRNRYLTVIGGCCALVLLVSCSVELGPNGLTVSLLGETLQFSLGADGLTIRVNAGETTERTAVGFTDYLTQPVQQTPAAGRMILRSEDVTVGRILTAKQSVRMQSAQLTGTATIRFYISQGQSADYCATADFLAEYNMTLTAGVLQIADEVYDLTNDAMEAIASNDVTICVEATADFDGEIQVFDFSFSFDDEDGNNPADDDDDDNVPAGTSTQVPINSLGQRVSPNATYGGIEYGIVGVLDVNSSTVNPAGLPSNVTQTLGVVDVDLDNLGLQSVERIEFASHAAWAPNLPNGLVIATLTCDYAEGGTSTIVDFALGSNTAEWSHERIEHVELGGCAHSQVPILYSYSTTQESRAAYNAHIYSASVDLDGSRTLTRLTLELNSTDVFVANRTWDVPEPTWAGQGLSAATLIGPSDSSGGDDDDPVTGGTGTVTGSVVDAQTGEALAGASISVTDTNISTSSDASGAFSLSDVPEGGQTLTASLTGYVQTTVPIVVFANGSAETSIGMLAIGAGGDNVAAVLAWGQDPRDLDLHMSGPDGSGGRFHAYYSNKTPVSHVFLDLDDTSSFGPETMTVQPPTEGGSYVSGDYHVWVHHYSGDLTFAESGASITLFAGGAQLSQYTATGGSGDASQRIWNVVNFTVAEDGSVSNIDVQQTFEDGSSGSTF